MKHRAPESCEERPVSLASPLTRCAACFALESFAVETHGSTSQCSDGLSVARRVNGWRVGPHFPGTRDEHGHPVMHGLVKQRNRIFCLSIAVDGFHDPRIRAYPG